MMENEMSEKDTKCNDEVGMNPFMIALYYCYTPRPVDDTNEHIRFQENCCEELELKGRVRVSKEGINGVLSGRKKSLEEYEERLRQELARSCSVQSIDDDGGEVRLLGGRHYGEELDVKYCNLREDISTDSQLFQNLSVKSTKEVISLVGQPVDHSLTNTKRSRRHHRKQKSPPLHSSEKETNTKHDNNNKIVLLDDHTNPPTTESSPTASCNRGKCGMTTLEEIQYHEHTPAEHLSPEKWNELLLSCTPSKSKPTNEENPGQQQQLDMETAKEQGLLLDSQNPDHININDAVLLDARNVYESRLGHFKIPGIPTILTNTRKYSSLPSVLDASIPHLAGKNVFMYCTGGVRCERASMYLQALAQTDRWGNHQKPKAIFQLEGGIQRYLERYGSHTKDSSTNTTTTTTTTTDVHNTSNEGSTEPKQIKTERNNTHDDEKKCLFKGHNFVFDPRRIDPIVGPDSPARCILCSSSHHDYDNGHAPSENNEARCCRCRILVLICNECRSTVRVWGENMGEEKSDKKTDENEQIVKPDLFCGPYGKSCIDEGNSTADIEIL